MKIKEIKNRFHMTDEAMPIDEERKKDSLLLLQKNIAEKQIGVLGNRKKVLLNQIRYMDKTMLGVHAILCVILFLITAAMKIQGAEEENIILFSMVLSGSLGVVSIVEISRVFFAGIAELSESCYFNVRQIVAFQMFLSGIVNLTVLLIGILFVGYQWKIDLLQIGLYVLVPFVMAECGCLRVLLSEAGRKNSYLLIMVGIFMIVFYMLLASMPELYQVTALAAWGIAFIIGLFLLGLQIKNLFRGIEKGEILCTN